LARELGVAPAPLAIAWCLRNPHVSTVLLGATRTDQLLQNLEALDWPGASTMPPGRAWKLRRPDAGRRSALRGAYGASGRRLGRFRQVGADDALFEHEIGIRVAFRRERRDARAVAEDRDRAVFQRHGGGGGGGGGAFGARGGAGGAGGGVGTRNCRVGTFTRVLATLRSRRYSTSAIAFSCLERNASIASRGGPDRAAIDLLDHVARLQSAELGAGAEHEHAVVGAEVTPQLRIHRREVEPVPAEGFGERGNLQSLPLQSPRGDAE
jgi:hypothetical protein